jgi:hypothetical protein
LVRSAVGGKALTVVSVDNRISEDVLARISLIEGVHEAKVVAL